MGKNGPQWLNAWRPVLLIKEMHANKGRRYFVCRHARIQTEFALELFCHKCVCVCVLRTQPDISVLSAEMDGIVLQHNFQFN